MPDPEKIELTPEQVALLRQRIEEQSLEPEDYKILSGMIDTLVFFKQAAEEKTISIKRLLNLLFGPTTETADEVLGHRKKGKKKKKGGQKPKGHGRKGASAYPGADKVCVSHPELRPKDICPACEKGKVYKSVKPGTLLRFLASVPVKATVYEMDKLRCNLCGEIFTAPVPEEAGPAKYDETVAAMIAVLKYGSGFPFYRIEKLQESFGIPLAASTQWELVKRQAEAGAQKAYEEMIRQAAQGEIIHNDDTTMKVLALMNLEDLQEQEEVSKQSRTGIYTTGLLSVKDDKKISLFFTGNKHAGENLEELLKQREVNRDPPIQMCDALSRNLPKSFQTVLSNCLCHARRNFVEVFDNFPEKCEYIIETMGQVYKNDEITLEQGMSPANRLAYHQIHSQPVMDELYKWLNKQFNENLEEHNSGLGKAISYMLNRWEPLTLFLKVENAPLHNNICERALKKAILHRKNALFYKTLYGAYIGDIYMSLIHTCNLTGANPFEYLTALALNEEAVKQSPAQWMPWNYAQNLSLSG